MNSTKKSIVVACLLCSSLLFGFNLGDMIAPSRLANVSANNLSQNATVVLCSGKEITSGRCTGSVYCTACSSCEYCAHCNSGGSCGVCGKRPAKKRKTYSASAKPKPKYRIITEKKKPTNFPLSNNSQKTLSIGDEYRITKATSLRELPDAKSSVMLRFKVDDEVVVIKEYDEWWSQVSFKNKIGFVKSRLLVKT